MSSRSLIAIAALLCAPAVSAQATDQDPGGSTQAPDPGPRSAEVDDQDPGHTPEVGVRVAQTDRVDADAVGARIVVTPVAQFPVLDDGRSALTVPAVPAAAPSDVRLDDGRGASAVPGAPTSAKSSDEVALDDGRGDAVVVPQRELKTAGSEDGRSTVSELTNVRPNPVRSRAELTFRADTDGTVTVTVYDLAGRRVAVAFDAAVAADVDTSVQLDLSGVAAGTYIAVLQTPTERVSRTFQVVR